MWVTVSIKDLLETGLVKWRTPKHQRSQSVSKITVGSPIATGFSNCQSPREQEFAIHRIDGQASFVPDRFHTSAPEMFHANHQVFLVVGGLTVLSAIVFRELKKEDGDTVSLHKVPQHVG
jgi:hypothetical protein